MATPEINENCHYVQNDPHRCKIKLEKSPRGRPPPPGEIGLSSKCNVSVKIQHVLFMLDGMN